MAAPPADIWTPIASFFQTYIQPDIPILAVTFLSIWFAFALSGRSARGKAKMSLIAEMRTNAKVTEDIVSYAEGQLSGDASIAPMPEYQMNAFLEFKRAGHMRKVPAKTREEIETLYLNQVSVNKAGVRQEELAFGPASTSPHSHTLRLENLTYLRDTAHNIIGPYQDRLKGAKF